MGIFTLMTNLSQKTKLKNSPIKVNPADIDRIIVSRPKSKYFLLAVPYLGNPIYNKRENPGQTRSYLIKVGNNDQLYDSLQFTSFTSSSRLDFA